MRNLIQVGGVDRNINPGLMPAMACQVATPEQVGGTCHQGG